MHFGPLRRMLSVVRDWTLTSEVAWANAEDGSGACHQLERV